MKVYLLVSLTLLVAYTFAQPQSKTYSLKKGQILDILLRNNNSQASQDAKDQFDSEVITRILEHGYQTMPYGLYFEPVAIQGNYSPSHMVLGGWQNIQARENAMSVLVTEVPNFHQLRRELWTTLFSTYYEIEKDISFIIKPDFFYVVTAYRRNKKSAFKKFKAEWATRVRATKGNIILELENGKSPFIGHFYEPHYFTISEWPNRNLFEDFLDKNKQMDHSSIEYVNQFVLRPEF